MTIGDMVGLAMIFAGTVLSAVGVIKGIKSRFHSLDAMTQCIVAPLIISAGTVIAKLL